MTRSLLRLLAAAFATLFTSAAAGPVSIRPPEAEVRAVVDTYWGIEVPDDYQYMENAGDPEVMAWAEGQNAYTRSWLDSYAGRDALVERVRALMRSDSPDYFAISYHGGRLFAIKRLPPKQQPFLVLLPSVRDLSGERILVDPNTIDPTGLTSIDFYKPSHDGRFVAVSLSERGTENGTLYLFDVATGEQLGDEIPRVNGGTAGGDVAWNASNDAIYYTRYPSPGERPVDDLLFYQQVWFHELGSPIVDDRYMLGETFPKIAEIEFQTSEEGRYLLAEVSNGDGGEYEFWFLPPGGAWKRFARFEDWVQDASFGPDGTIFLLSRKDAPRKKILRMETGDPDLAKAVTVVPELEGVITSFALGDSTLYVSEMVGGPTKLEAYDLDGGPVGSIAMGEISTLSGLVPLEGDELLIRRQSYTSPPAWFLFKPGMPSPEPTALVTTSPADFSDTEVRRVHASADDGTRVPINIMMRRGTPLDGSAPLLLYGYGSYGISQQPRFRADRRIWIEQGGIFAIASVRGGGEFGDAWHRAANLERKKRSMDDFAACARYLVEENYTSKEKLAIEGGSAGGLLVYGTMALYPDVMAAVVSHVGISDALRTELSPNGAFNITEFGTVKDEKQFRGMYAYSPFHKIRDGVAYPAVLSLTGLNDPRVEPWQSFKMTARLQATGTSRPVLLRVSTQSGHGGGSLDQREGKTADTFTFLFKYFGIRYRPIPG